MAKSRAKRIVLTGVSRGLGLAMAEGFIEAGHTVCGCARSSEAIEKLRKRFGAPHRFSTLDVADDAVTAPLTASLVDLGAVEVPA